MLVSWSGNIELFSLKVRNLFFFVQFQFYVIVFFGLFLLFSAITNSSNNYNNRYIVQVEQIFKKNGSLKLELKWTLVTPGSDTERDHEAENFVNGPETCSIWTSYPSVWLTDSNS